MESRHVSVADNMSRFLSLLAIVAALGSSVFLYQSNQRLKTELAKISSAPTDPAVFQKHADKWDKKLTDALDEFGNRAEVATSKFDQAREARNKIMRTATDMSGVNEVEVKELVSKMLADLALPTPEPELVVANTVMRPSEAGDLVLPRVRNTGNAEAEIRAVRFKPKQGSVFAVKEPIQPNEDQVVVEFDPIHNLGADPGFHRYYERSYNFPELVVPEKKMVDIVIEIRANGEHLDWGMMGELELEYQNGRTVLIPGARAVFVADKENTT